MQKEHQEKLIEFLGWERIESEEQFYKKYAIYDFRSFPESYPVYVYDCGVEHDRLGPEFGTYILDYLYPSNIEQFFNELESNK